MKTFVNLWLDPSGSPWVTLTPSERAVSCPKGCKYREICKIPSILKGFTSKTLFLLLHCNIQRTFWVATAISPASTFGEQGDWNQPGRVILYILVKKSVWQALNLGFCGVRRTDYVHPFHRVFCKQRTIDTCLENNCLDWKKSFLMWKNKKNMAKLVLPWLFCFSHKGKTTFSN